MPYDSYVYSDGHVLKIEYQPYDYSPVLSSLQLLFSLADKIEGTYKLI